MTLVVRGDRSMEIQQLLVDDDDDHDETQTCFKTRHTLVFMLFTGFICLYCQRVAISVSMVAMVISTSLKKNMNVRSECGEMDAPTPSDDSSEPTGEFEWDPNTQGLVIGAFFYGYCMTPLAGGWLAERYGSKRIFGLGCLTSILMTLLTPAAARAGVPYIVAARLVAGFAEGFTMPAAMAMLALWVPAYERTVLNAIAFSGCHLGTMLGMPITGLLCRYGFAGGWPSAFYVIGVAGFVWVMVWGLLAYDSPAQHPRISARERDAIQNSVGLKEHLATPWRGIATSPAAWAVILAQFCGNYSFLGMLNSIPTYMNNILGFNIKQNGFLSAMPFLVMWTMEISVGSLSDYLRRHEYLSTIATRKCMVLLGSCVFVTSMVAIGFVGCNSALSVALLATAVGGLGVFFVGFAFNYIDIAPRFAGTLKGIGGTLANSSGILAPATLGYLTNDHESTREWRTFFFIAAGVNLTGAVLFALLARGEEQSWAKGASAPNNYPYTYTSMDKEKGDGVKDSGSDQN